MFSRISVFFFALATCALLAVATPGEKPPKTTTVTVTQTVTATSPASQCNTGPIQCCNTVEPATSPDATALLGLLGIVLTDMNVLVGITCTPISVIGVGGNSCTAQPVCCENNNFSGVIVIGCTPVNINL